VIKIQLKDKISVVTGGSKGLGREIAKALAAEGSHVIICSRSKGDLLKVCDEIKSTDGKCSYSVLDVTKISDVNNFIDDIIKSHGRIDILINNAGYVTEWKPIERNTPKEFKDCFETNIYSIFYFLKKIIPLMRKQNDGFIVNISSMAGKRSVPNLAAYSASKSGAIGLTQSVAKELKNTNIRCISVCPSGMNTEMREKVFGREDAQKQQDPKLVASIIRDILLKKIGVPNGGDIVIRNNKILSIKEAPEF